MTIPSDNNTPAFLPPRRPVSASLEDGVRTSSRASATPPSLPPRRPALIPVLAVTDVSHTTSPPLSAPTTTQALEEDTRSQAIAGALQRLEGLATTDEDVIGTVPLRSRSLVRSLTPVARPSSLRYESRPGSAAPSNYESSRPSSYARSRSNSILDVPVMLDSSVPMPAIPPHMQLDPWKLPPLEQGSVSRSSSQHSRMRAKPRASLSRLSSLDSLISFHEDRQEWKRESMLLQSASGEHDASVPDLDFIQTHHALEEKRIELIQTTTMPSGVSTPDSRSSPSPSVHGEASSPKPTNRFRHFAAEVGFCFTIAMTQLLAEYKISGFAIELPKILARARQNHDNPGDMGEFWPASLLSLILSATLLIFARISDMYGGYLPFMFGVLWLGIWSLVAGFAEAGVLLDVARAMEGLAIAAFIPSTFAMVGSIYPEGGKRKNLVLGLYSGCAPVGFFAGFLVAGALPDKAPGWYFWIASALAFVTAITAYLTVPMDRTNREEMKLKMDWIGAFLITAGLILVAYALAVEPYAGRGSSHSGWSTAMVLGPLISGLVCLAVAFWVEGWFASCPLLPFDFFTPKSVKALSLACLCFYACYGVWLYESAQYFQSPELTGTPNGIHGVRLAGWYTPTAVGGLILCVASGYLVDIVPPMLLIFVSGLAWIAAPLLLALCPLPVNYWAYVMPSMLCATIGIDLTFTVSVVFLAAVQPLRYQGLAGAVSSILVNLAMSFSLSISEIVAVKARADVVMPGPESPGWAEASFRRTAWPFQTAFFYAAASAGVGLIITVLFVRISRSVMKGQPSVKDGVAASSSGSSEASTRIGSDEHERYTA